jgi:hypothetical protein
VGPRKNRRVALAYCRDRPFEKPLRAIAASLQPLDPCQLVQRTNKILRHEDLQSL